MTINFDFNFYFLNNYKQGRTNACRTEYTKLRSKVFDKILIKLVN